MRTGACVLLLFNFRTNSTDMGRFFGWLLVGAGAVFVIDACSAQVQNLVPEKIKELVEAGACVVLDVRTPEEFASGHLPGAINIDYYSEAFRSELEKLPRDTAYCVYCRSGRRSAAAAELMKEMGFRVVYNMLGGITAWQEKGYPVEEEK